MDIPPERNLLVVTASWLARAFARDRLRTTGSYLGVALVLILVFIGGGHEIEAHLGTIEAWMQQLGPWAMVAYAGLYILATSLLVPDTILCLVAGALFGLPRGVFVVLAASVVAGILQFTLSRHLVRGRVQQMLAKRTILAAIQRAVIRDEFRLQVLLRLTPVNPATINYFLGAAGVRFLGFFVAIFAHLPHLLVEVYAGHVGKHAVKLIGTSSRSVDIHDLMVIGGLLLGFIALIVVSKIAHKAVVQAGQETTVNPT